MCRTLTSHLCLRGEVLLMREWRALPRPHHRVIARVGKTERNRVDKRVVILSRPITHSLSRVSGGSAADWNVGEGGIVFSLPRQSPFDFSHIMAFTRLPCFSWLFLCSELSHKHTGVGSQTEWNEAVFPVDILLGLNPFVACLPLSLTPAFPCMK